MLGPLKVSRSLADMLGLFASAVVEKRVQVGSVELHFTLPFGVRVDRVGPAARITINPEPTVVVSGWPDPKLAHIDLMPDGTGKIVAQGAVMTYTVEIQRKD
jgi:hypothetical protein